MEKKKRHYTPMSVNGGLTSCVRVANSFCSGVALQYNEVEGIV